MLRRTRIQIIEAQHDDKQRGLFGQPVQEGSPEDQRTVSERSAYGMAGEQKESEEARLENSFKQVKEVLIG